MKIDIITGLLGAGKTTFIKRYVRHLVDKEQNVCILVNDYGAISVDMALLNHELGDIADLEMVTAGDFDCYLRRTKTKLIQMAMLGYDRIVVEPSGVFDADDFYDILHEEPLDRWYEIGNVISLVEADLPEHLPEDQEYLLMAQAVTAGKIVISKMKDNQDPAALKERLVSHLNRGSGHFRCERQFKTSDILAFDWDKETEEDVKAIDSAGYVRYDMSKRHIEEEGDFETLFYYTVKKSLPEVEQMVEQLFSQEKYGDVIRVKGLFQDTKTGKWYEINSTSTERNLHELDTKKEVMLVIGERLNHEEVNKAFGETRNVLDYDV